MQVQLQTLLPYTTSRANQNGERVGAVQPKDGLPNGTDSREFGSQPTVRFVPQSQKPDASSADQQRYSYVRVDNAKGRTAQALKTYEDVESNNRLDDITLSQALDLFV